MGIIILFILLIASFYKVIYCFEALLFMAFCINIAVFWLKRVKDQYDIKAPWDKAEFKKNIQQHFEEIFFAMEFEDDYISKPLRFLTRFFWNLTVWRMVIEPAFEFLLVPSEVDRYLREYGKCEASSIRAIREFTRYRTKHGSAYTYTILTLIFAVIICACIRKFGQYENDKNRLKAKHITLYRWLLDRVFASVAKMLDELIVEQDMLQEQIEDNPRLKETNLPNQIKYLDIRIGQLREWRKTILDWQDNAAAAERQLRHHSKNRVRDLKSYERIKSILDPRKPRDREMLKFETARLARNDRRIIVADEQSKCKYWYVLLINISIVLSEKLNKLESITDAMSVDEIEKREEMVKFYRKWGKYLYEKADSLLYNNIDSLCALSKSILKEDIIEITTSDTVKPLLNDYDWELINELVAFLSLDNNNSVQNPVDVEWMEEYRALLEHDESVGVLQRLKDLNLKEYLAQFSR